MTEVTDKKVIEANYIDVSDQENHKWPELGLAPRKIVSIKQMQISQN